MKKAHRQFRLPGIGQAFFSQWFAFAGHAGDRAWQPLILDSRVYATLNSTLGVSTETLAGTRNRASRYATYVATLHAWAQQLANPGITGQRLEWLLFQHNGHEAPL